MPDKKRLPPTSNKRKRAELKVKREIRRKKKLAREGRLVRGREIPVGSIAADISQQAPNNSISARLYYVDKPFRCADCGAEEVWTASQQKWYYEVAKGPIYGEAKRCRACRARRRQQREEQRRKLQPKK
jgi:hypothetical protein